MRTIWTMTLALLVFVVSQPLVAKTLDLVGLKEGIEIDRGKGTVLILPETAELSLAPSWLKVEPMGEEDGTKVWQIEPKCRRNCRESKGTIELILSSGDHVVVNLTLAAGIADHVLKLDTILPRGKIALSRTQALHEARATLTQHLRGFPPLRRVQHDPPESLKKLVPEWRTFVTDTIELFEAKVAQGEGIDLPAIDLPGTLLAMRDGELLLIAARRRP